MPQWPIPCALTLYTTKLEAAVMGIVVVVVLAALAAILGDASQSFLLPGYNLKSLTAIEFSGFVITLLMSNPGVTMVVVARGRERKRHVPGEAWLIIPRQPAGRSVLCVFRLQRSSPDGQIFPQRNTEVRQNCSSTAFVSGQLPIPGEGRRANRIQHQQRQ